jgi:hypothetical protein
MRHSPRRPEVSHRAKGRSRGSAPGLVAVGGLRALGLAAVDEVGGRERRRLHAAVPRLIARLYVVTTVLVLCAQIDVARVKRLWPRALLTPFTDDVDLTPGDQDTYADAATAQRTKGFESVDVNFDNEGQNATARRKGP